MENSEKKSSAPFCTCDKFGCALHPVNHDKGCTLCIAKNLRTKELPNCYFDLLGGCGSREDDSFETFAELVLAKKSGEEEQREKQRNADT